MNMKTKLTALAAIACVVLASAFNFSDEFTLGKKAPLTTLKMKSVNSQEFSLNDLKEKNGLLVVFSCNTCPFVLGWEDRYNELNDLAKQNGIGMVLINSNEAKRDGDDSMAEMVKHARSKGYSMPYLADAKHQLADAFNAKTTPHVYLLNKNMELTYVGAIDDNMKDKSAVKETYLKDALKSQGTGKAIKTTQSKAVGCSIKRVS